jgi:drug/metabolite transporter (DMT)-like permease
MNVIAVAILSWRFFQESFGLRKQLAVVIGVLGAVMITTNGELSTLTHGEFLGDVLVFFAGLAWAVFIVLHKRVLSRSDKGAVELSAVVMSATAFLLFPVALLFGRLGVQVIPIEGWGWIVYTAIVCQVVPYALWVLALKSVTATIASVVGMLEIVAAMMLSSLLLGESYNTVTLLGACLILLSIPAVAES